MTNDSIVYLRARERLYKIKAVGLSIIVLLLYGGLLVSAPLPTLVITGFCASIFVGICLVNILNAAEKIGDAALYHDDNSKYGSSRLANVVDNHPITAKIMRKLGMLNVKESMDS